MADVRANRPDSVDSGDVSKQRKDEMEQELLEKLPDKTTKAQEWGHGYATGKAIASGGNPDGPTEDAKGETPMNIPDDTLDLEHGVYLKTEGGGVALVFCSRCDAEIGRVQTAPESTDKADVVTEQVHGELAVIATEHRASCRNKQPT